MEGDFIVYLLNWPVGPTYFEEEGVWQCQIGRDSGILKVRRRDQRGGRIGQIGEGVGRKDGVPEERDMAL